MDIKELKDKIQMARDEAREHWLNCDGNNRRLLDAYGMRVQTFEDVLNAIDGDDSRLFPKPGYSIGY